MDKNGPEKCSQSVLLCQECQAAAATGVGQMTVHNLAKKRIKCFRRVKGQVPKDIHKKCQKEKVTALRKSFKGKRSNHYGLVMNADFLWN